VPNSFRVNIFTFIFFLVLGAYASTIQGQESTTFEDVVISDTVRLDKVADALDEKTATRDRLKQAIAAGKVTAADVQYELEQLNVDIKALSETFDLLTVGDIDGSLFSVEKDKPFDWRLELMLVIEPLLDSLQSLTEKPRQLNDLKKVIERNLRRQEAVEQALIKLEDLSLADYEDDTRQLIKKVESKWRSQKKSIEQRLVAAQAQLERLHRVDDSADSSSFPIVQKFVRGRGLTLLLAAIAAIFSWLFSRFLWWVFSTQIVTKDHRRRSLWYRLYSYSFYLVNILICIVVVLAVLYVREDGLLLALAIVLLGFSALGIRTYIPAYVREARLLLNLGSVREGERVMYKELPWQVNSINLYTVLWNPWLDGIVRLPLETVETLTSRPIKDTSWFPSQKGDYVLLPDGRFGQVLSQTPEAVQLRILGGMIQWFRTPDYYAMNVINLSAGQFGVMVTFGFDYSLQAISLTEIPNTLYQSVKNALDDAGYNDFIESLLVELKSASTSSIDYLIFVSVKSEKASDYYRLERIIQQTCVAVANENDWNIPFPQMMVHYQPASNS
jgi:hypothetical protein